MSRPRRKSYIEKDLKYYFLHAAFFGVAIAASAWVYGKFMENEAAIIKWNAYVEKVCKKPCYNHGFYSASYRKDLNACFCNDGAKWVRLDWIK